MSDVSPGDQDGDGTGLDILEDGDCLRVRHSLHRHPVNREDLVTCKKIPFLDFYSFTRYF